MPLWHNAAFKNNNSNTYYCPKLIREGILTVRQVFTANHFPKEDLLVQLAPTWQQVYRELRAWQVQTAPTQPMVSALNMDVCLGNICSPEKGSLLHTHRDKAASADVG